MKPGFTKIQCKLEDKYFPVASLLLLGMKHLRICVHLINITNGYVSPRFQSCPPRSRTGLISSQFPNHLAEGFPHQYWVSVSRYRGFTQSYFTAHTDADLLLNLGFVRGVSPLANKGKAAALFQKKSRSR